MALAGVGGLFAALAVLAVNRLQRRDVTLHWFAQLEANRGDARR
jgi:hypothetical protein